MHGQFIRHLPEVVDKEKTWQWLSKCDLKVGTEALICAAQEQSIRTNYAKNHIDKRLKARCVDCAARKVKVCNILSVLVGS